jgi:hypothetical protein
VSFFEAGPWQGEGSINNQSTNQSIIRKSLIHSQIKLTSFLKLALGKEKGQPISNQPTNQ